MTLKPSKSEELDVKDLSHSSPGSFGSSSAVHQIKPPAFPISKFPFLLANPFNALSGLLFGLGPCEGFLIEFVVIVLGEELEAAARRRGDGLVGRTVSTISGTGEGGETTGEDSREG
jgi:hypothetical protein